MASVNMDEFPFSCRSASADDTEAVGCALAANVRAGDWILLAGPLGSGKTVFTRGFCRGLGMQQLWEVDSPTYTLINQYPTDPIVVHMDLYRIQGVDDLQGLNLDAWADSSAIVVVEWPDRLALWHRHCRGFLVRIDPTPSRRGQRLISIQPFDTRSPQNLGAVQK